MIYPFPSSFYIKVAHDVVHAQGTVEYGVVYIFKYANDKIEVSSIMGRIPIEVIQYHDYKKTKGQSYVVVKVSSIDPYIPFSLRNFW